MNNVDRRLDRLETTLETRFGAMDQRFNWLTGIVVGTWITTILTVLFRH